jgi:hypothetical protein
MAMTSAEKSRALKERMKALGLTARTIYIARGEPTPSREELAAFIAWKRGNGAGEPPQPTATGGREPDGRLPPTVDETENKARTAATGPEAPQTAAEAAHQAPAEPAPEPPKPDRKQWYAEAKAERDSAARQEVKRIALDADHNTENGIIEGVCKAAAFLVQKDDLSKARELLKAEGITHDKAEAVLYPDHRRRMSIVLTCLEKAGAWE